MEKGEPPKLTSSTTTQVQIQGFEIAQPKIYIIYEHLGFIKGAVLLIQSCRISMTQGSNRITGRSLGEDPILMVSQGLEILRQTKDAL